VLKKMKGILSQDFGRGIAPREDGQVVEQAIVHHGHPGVQGFGKGWFIGLRGEFHGGLHLPVVAVAVFLKARQVMEVVGHESAALGEGEGHG